MPSSWRLQAAEVKETSVQHVSKSSTLESSVDEATKTSTVDYLRSVGIEPVTAEQLFDKHHVDKWTPQLLAYFPLGCALAAIRFSAWIAGETRTLLMAAIYSAAISSRQPECTPTQCRNKHKAYSAMSAVVLYCPHLEAAIGCWVCLSQSHAGDVGLITTARLQ